LSSTKAQGVSPIVVGLGHDRRGLHRVLVQGILDSIDEMFSPPEMMMSLERSLSWMYRRVHHTEIAGVNRRP